MSGIRLRYWLPVANLAIDAALLGMLAWSIHGRLSVEKRPSPSSGAIMAVIPPVMYLEAGETGPGWGPMIAHFSTPPQFLGILFGTPPAAVLSASGVRGGAMWWALSWRWACLNEGLAVLVWFGVGWIAESRLRRKWVLRYLALRAVSVAASLSGGAMGLCVLAMLLAWIAAGAWLVGWGFRSGVRLLRGSRLNW